jgi:MFS transporter, PAT family, beta-lactamase induction signal transducer AmpG
LLFGFATLDPTTDLLAIAGIAVLASFISATFDIVLDAWRIETARDKEDIDALSTLVQAGYRSAAFVGGAGALILSDHMSWNVVIMVLALIMALTLVGSIIAPEPKHAGISALAAKTETNLRYDQKGRNIVVGLVSLGWLWAFWTLGSFMVDSLLHPETTKAGPFTLTMGPLIVAATVLGPALGAVWLIWFRKPAAASALWGTRPLKLHLLPR